MRRRTIIIAAILVALVAGAVAVDSIPTKAERELHALRDSLRRQSYKFASSDVVVPGLTEADTALAERLFRLRKEWPLSDLSDEQFGIGIQNGKSRSAWLTGHYWTEHIGNLSRYESNFPRIGDAGRFLLENRLIHFGHIPDFQRPSRFRRQAPIALGDLSRIWTIRTVRDLRAGRPDEAWTNLLLVNRVAANYRPTPRRWEYNRRLTLLDEAFAATWEAMQCHQWSDTQLAVLEQTWKDADLFSGVEDLPAVNCAGVMEAIEAGPLLPFPDIRSFGDIRDNLSWTRLEELYHPYREERDYRRDHAIADLLTFMRFGVWQTDRLRQALRSPSWRDMQGLTNRPGKADDFVFSSSGNAWLGQKFFPHHTMETINYAAMDSIELDMGMLKMVEAEAKRRLLLAALAVERAKLRLGRLPATLAEAGTLLPDYMDGQPLRYRPEADGTYLIYSVGMDMKDAGRFGYSSDIWNESLGDIVWPRCNRKTP